MTSAVYSILLQYPCMHLGIVPVFCEEIFKGINEKLQEGDTTQYEVQSNQIVWCNF